MGALIAGYAFAAIFLASAVFRSRRLEDRIAGADEASAVDIRKLAESRWILYMFGSWSILCALGGVLLLLHGDLIGLAWFGVAIMYLASIHVYRRSSERSLTGLGDRGRIERASRYLSRASRSNRWAAAGFTAYVGTRIVEMVSPDPKPVGVMVILVGLGGLTLVGGLGFAILRTRIYLQGDDLAT